MGGNIMETVTVKIHNSTQTIEEFKVEIGNNNLVSIEAQKNVNYEFFSDNIQAAPNHIITKRVDEDLHVSFERSGQNTNLVIENFYEISKSYVIGKTEEDLYYYYIPDTTQVNDFINNLQMGDMEGHALGGEQATTTPWWIGESEVGATNYLPSINDALDYSLVAAADASNLDYVVVQHSSSPSLEPSIDVFHTASATGLVDVLIPNYSNNIQSADLYNDMASSRSMDYHFNLPLTVTTLYIDIIDTVV